MSLSGEALLQAAAALEAQQRPCAALDLIFDAVDDLLLEGRFEEVDTLLKTMPVDLASTDILMTFLTSAGPARSKLVHWQDFVTRVKQAVESRGESEPGLFNGLAGELQ